jgi:hypothetical protein
MTPSYYSNHPHFLLNEFKTKTSNPINHVIHISPSLDLIPINPNNNNNNSFHTVTSGTLIGENKGMNGFFKSGDYEEMV